MIVKMRKVSFIFLDSEKDAALDKIRNAGVVHLERTPGSSETLTTLIAERDKVQRALGRLDQKSQKDTVSYSRETAGR